jgi:outer membrane biosynthesis protein TonB
MIRPVWVSLVAWLAASPALASMTVPPFAASEDLSMFAPEVARAVAFALDRAGVDVNGGGAKVETVSGRIEAIDRDRVRLKACVGSHAVQVVGPLERIDDLASDLAGRLASALPASARRAPGSAPRLAAAPAARLPGPALAALTTAAAPAAAPAPPPAPKPAAAPVDPPKADPPKADPPKADPPKADPPKPVDTPKPPPAEETKPPPAPPPEEKKPPAEDPKTPPPVLNPYPASPPTSYVPPPPPPVYAPPRRWRGGYASMGRTVLHSIGTPEGCASGAWATYAARDVLERRIHVQTVSTGACGFLSQAAAAAEAQRAGVRSVVMAAFESLRMEQGSVGLRPIGRLRVIVVRDGQVVLDRAPELSGHSAAVADLSRAAYDLVAEGFGLLAGDLAAVLADGH